MKDNRELLQFGTFYRLHSPFNSDQAAWMVVSKDKNKAIFGLYYLRSNVNTLPGFLRLEGLSSDKKYVLLGEDYYGDELMNLGVTLTKLTKNSLSIGKDFASYVEVLEAKE